MNISSISNLLWRFVKNPYSRPSDKWLWNHIPGKEVRSGNKITREEKQHFFLREAKTSNHLLEVSNFINNVTEELKKIFHERWVNDLFGKESEKKHKEFCDALKEKGPTIEQIKSIINYAVDNVDRIKNWAYDNEKVGKVASSFMTFAIPLGIIRNFISNLDFISPIVKKTVSFFYALTFSMRGYYQYSDRVYNRPDDEVAMNKYQAEVYGNVVSGNLGAAACVMETKVNPIVLTVTSLLSNNRSTLDNTIAILTIPNLSWWRVRMPAHINQEYLTDLLRYVLYKPLSLLGVESSKKVIQEIKDRGNLELSYVVRRHYENLGIKDKKDQRVTNFVLELTKSIKNSVGSKDTKLQQDSAKKAGETIAPVFGIIAFAATTLGVPIRLLSKSLHKYSRVTDFFNSLSISCQQSIYFFKMVVPAIYNVKKTKSTLLEPDLNKKLSKKEIEDLKTLLAKYKKLTFIGLATFLSSIINSTLKLIRFDNESLEKIKSTIEGLSGDLVSKFFSERRHVLGFQFKAENPEFYENEEICEEEKPKEDVTENQLVIKHLTQVDFSLN